MNELVMPSYKTEVEEAQWWFDHQDRIAEDLLSSAVNRDPVRGATAKEMGLSARISISMDDVPVALQQARQEGLLFDEYAKRLFHRALQSDLKKVG